MVRFGTKDKINIGIYSSLTTLHARIMALWCSWLSLLSNTQAVPGSSPGEVILFAAALIFLSSNTFFISRDLTGVVSPFNHVCQGSPSGHREDQPLSSTVSPARAQPDQTTQPALFTPTPPTKLLSWYWLYSSLHTTPVDEPSS